MYGLRMSTMKSMTDDKLLLSVICDNKYSL